jgi:hypothetical protein
MFFRHWRGKNPLVVKTNARQSPSVIIVARISRGFPRFQIEDPGEFFTELIGLLKAPREFNIIQAFLGDTTPFGAAPLRTGMRTYFSNPLSEDCIIVK